MNKRKRKNDVLWMIIGVLVLATFVFSGIFISQLSILNNAYADLTQIEYLSSSTQRLTRLVIAGQSDEKLLFYIDDQTTSALSHTSKDALSIIHEPYFSSYTESVHSSWTQLHEIIQAEEVNMNGLYMAADSHFYQMTDLSTEVTQYTAEINSKITQIQGVITILMSIIGLVILNNVMRTHTELKQSKAMAKVAQIDMATGLYNRSKCQELFKQNHSGKGNKKPALIVFDLNDLKKTNDVQGHRMGDELIHAFAAVLKSACEVHIVPPFIGRYGGDEFIVYYEDVASEEEVTVFLKELNFLSDNYNADAVNFKISYAVGYAVAENTNANLTIRQLFDKADASMYENKKSMKGHQRHGSEEVT